MENKGEKDRFYRCKPEALKKEQLGTRLPRWLLDWLRNQDESQSVMIENALIGYYSLVQPEVVKIRRKD